MTADDLTVRAARLSEEILDEVTRPNQDWCAIAARARELAALAAAAGGAGGAREEDT